jgi:hypothetical protein
MWSFIFYAMGFVFLFHEISVLMEPSRAYWSLKGFMEEDDDEKKEEHLKNIPGIGGLGMILYVIWGIIGLFTSQFIFFALLFVISFISKTKFPYNTGKILFIIDSLISIIIIFLIMWNGII